MSIFLIDLLTKNEVSEVRNAISLEPKESWSEGATTAGFGAKSQKKNSQMLKPPQKISDLVEDKLRNTPSFSSIAWPEEVERAFISRYDSATKDHYGLHVDSGIRGKLKRRDLSVSILLSEPEEYDGGEMVFNFGSVNSTFKPAAGTAVVFSSFLEHQIMPIVKGERFVALTWLTSRISDSRKREILWNLAKASNHVARGNLDKAELEKLLAFSYANLTRLWL
jgi:PKHD-type hydroxylase